jgi:hypothetical protein
MKLQKFTGINNVLPPERCAEGELAEATNVDIGLANEITRREGYSVAGAATLNVWEAAGGFVLGTVAGDLKNLTTSTTLHAALGSTRVWYHDLADGRVLYSNGVTMGIVAASGATKQAWGVPIPANVGSAADTAGSLPDGGYRYSLTYRRTADGAEGGPVYSGTVTVALGGIALTGLPTLAGHSINVYITTHDGEVGYYAGNTTGSTFTLTSWTPRTRPCLTNFLSPPPAGILPKAWRGRTLIAVGPVLYASKPAMPELFDLRRDFKQFGSDITLVEPVEGGIWIGTEAQLVFMAGTTLDSLVLQPALRGEVVLGSGVPVPGEHLVRGKGAAGKAGMVCIANRVLVAGYADGGHTPLTEGRYAVASSVHEVAATFRLRTGRVPQYIAQPQ